MLPANPEHNGVRSGAGTGTDEAVAAVGRYVGRHGTADDRETLRRAEAMAGRFGEWCERLGGAAVGASLDHNDLHLRSWSWPAGSARWGGP